MINPVFRREIKTSLRTWKTFFSIMVYAIFLLAVAIVGYISISSSVPSSGFNPSSTEGIYIAMAAVQIVLIMIIVPAITGGAISGERERQTLDLMFVTKMTTKSIIIGKIMSSLLIVLLMIFASMPVFAIIMYFGSINIFDVLGLSLFFLATAAFSACISIFFSVVCKRTVAAIIITYLVTFIPSIFVLAAALITNIFRSIINLSQGTPGKWEMQLAYWMFSTNPFQGLISILDSQTGANNINNQIESITDTLTSVSAPAFANSFPFQIPLWTVNILFDVIMIVVVVQISSVLLKPVSKSKKFK